MAATKLLAQRCIITGASRGIGAAIAQRFAAEGAHCTLIGRNHTSLEEIRAGLPTLHEGPRSEASLQQRHRILVGDVGVRAFWEGLGKGEDGNVDILVNAAGLTHYSLLLAARPERLEAIVQTNLMGTIWSCQVLVKGMVRRKKGCIINVSSLLGVKGGKGSTVYAASKAGVIGLTRSLAEEVGPKGIRVNAIVPGYIDTQMTEDMNPEARSQALDKIPLKRFGRVEEVADAAAFLANNEYASNCVLNLDGGLSAT